MGTRRCCCWLLGGRPLMRVIVAVGVLLGATFGPGAARARGSGAGEDAVDPNALLQQLKPWVLDHLERTSPLPARDGTQGDARWRLPGAGVTIVSPEALWWLTTTAAPLEVAGGALARMLSQSPPDPRGVASLLGNTLATVLRLLPAPVAELPLLALELPSRSPLFDPGRRPGLPTRSRDGDAPGVEIFLRGDVSSAAEEAVVRALLVPSLVRAAQLRSLPEMQDALRWAQQDVLASRDPSDAYAALARVQAIQLARHGQATSAMREFAKTLTEGQRAALAEILRDPRPSRAQGGLASLANSIAGRVLSAIQRAELDGRHEPARSPSPATLGAMPAVAKFWADATPETRTQVLANLHKGTQAIDGAGLPLPPELLRGAPSSASSRRGWVGAPPSPWVPRRSSGAPRR